jgi:hypothetical protein
MYSFEGCASCPTGKKDRIPSKVNLCIRGIVDVEAKMCIGGCRNEETTNRLFFKYPIF